jgi:GH24 family phage-related lysozyme (muramidase)
MALNPDIFSPDKGKRILAVLGTAVTIAVPAEGIKLTHYYDPPGILTVCRGHTGSDIVKGKVYTIAECDKWMDDDMRKAVKQVDACVPNLPGPVHAAFSDAVFNLGPKIVCNQKASTAARYLAAGQYEKACNELPKWDKARVYGEMQPLKGLTKRRAEERDLCLLHRDYLFPQPPKGVS